MNPLVVISALFASAIAAPQFPAGTVGLAHAAAPILGHPVAHPLGYAAAAHAVQPAAISLPAPHTTQHKEPDVVTHHKPAPIITKEVHLGQTQYISGYATQILKPAIPDFKIAVPTALKGTQSVSAPIVTVQKKFILSMSLYMLRNLIMFLMMSSNMLKKSLKCLPLTMWSNPTPYPNPTPLQVNPSSKRSK